MPQILTFEEIASELRAAILSGDTALVIGAGASFTSGAPLASGLVAEIRAKFPLAAIDEEATFLDAATEVCDTPPYGRIKLVRMLKDLLAPLEPSPSYKQIPRVKWSAIFTTNYDDLIEKAYLSPGRVQSIQPIHLPYEGNVLPRANHVLLYYLQGSIKES
ncbi:MAG TPA: SIR2 family protein, partial [Longimicrobium sp.]